MTPAERSKRYRERLKQNPLKYETYLQKKKDRNKKLKNKVIEEENIKQGIQRRDQKRRKKKLM